MGLPLRLANFRPPRSLHSFRNCIVFVLLVVSLVQQQRLFFLYRYVLSTKYSPTVFDVGFEQTESRLWQSVDKGSMLQREIIANRGAWRVLGSGWEGSTFAYNDVVVKTFTPGRSPFRNCAPSPESHKWPTEIPASLYFGNLVATGDTNSSSTVSHLAGFLPVKAYFLAAHRDSRPEWHLVTPLLHNGNLDSLIQRSSDPTRGYNELDRLFRPALNRLLRTLTTMHHLGYCHENIKTSNIFVETDTQWVLGDLGNVRHVTHPYHSSRIWTDNGQLRDCRANDVVRTIRSYLSFIRAVSGDKAAFDADFFEARSPLVKLYWWSVGHSQTITAEDLRARSASNGFVPPSGGYPDVLQTDAVGKTWVPWRLLSNGASLKRAVKRALKTSLNEDLARLLAWTWLLGLPDSSC